MNRFFSRLTAEARGEKYVPAESSSLPPRRDNQEGGIGVPVPAGPKPLRGGAAAQFPLLEEELEEAAK